MWCCLNPEERGLALLEQLNGEDFKTVVHIGL
jgi:hypothetical protein